MLTARSIGLFTAPLGDSVFDADNICPSPASGRVVQRMECQTNRERSQLTHRNTKKSRRAGWWALRNKRYACAAVLTSTEGGTAEMRGTESGTAVHAELGSWTRTNDDEVSTRGGRSLVADSCIHAGGCLPAGFCRRELLRADPT